MVGVGHKQQPPKQQEAQPPKPKVGGLWEKFKKLFKEKKKKSEISKQLKKEELPEKKELPEEVKKELLEEVKKQLKKYGYGRSDETLRGIGSYLIAKFASEKDPAAKMSEKVSKIIDSVKDIEREAASFYFDAIGLMGAEGQMWAVERLTSERFLNFLRKSDDVAHWYIKAIVRMIKTFKTFKTLKTLKTSEAIYLTGAVEKLTSERILNFAEKVGSNVASNYFEAIYSTGLVEKLTSDSILNFAKEMGSDTISEYFDAISRVGAEGQMWAVGKLTSDSILNFAKKIENEAARAYFEVIRQHPRSVDRLTSESVLEAANSFKGIGYDEAYRRFKKIA